MYHYSCKISQQSCMYSRDQQYYQHIARPSKLSFWKSIHLYSVCYIFGVIHQKSQLYKGKIGPCLKRKLETFKVNKTNLCQQIDVWPWYSSDLSNMKIFPLSSLPILIVSSTYVMSSQPSGLNIASKRS